MVSNFIGLLLAFSIVLHLWAIRYFFRLNLKTFFVPLQIYFNLLIIILELSAIFLLQSTPISFQSTIFNIYFIAQVFIPPVIYLLNQTFSLEIQLPRFSWKHVFFFGLSSLLSILALGGYLIDGEIANNGVIHPKYTSLFWIFILYFYLMLYYLLSEFIKKYRLAKRKEEIDNLRHTINIIIPALFFSFACLHFLPFWGIVHPLIFLCYPIISFTLIYTSFQWNMVDLDEYVSRSLGFFLITGLYLVMASLLPVPNRFVINLVSIPVIWGAFWISNHSLAFLQKKISEHKANGNYDREEELEKFVREIGKFIYDEELAQFLADYSRRILHCTKCAVITSRFDVHPYKIIFSDGFDNKTLEELLSNTNSPLLEALELDRVVLNRQQLPTDSSIYHMMLRYKMYLGVPLLVQNKLVGFLFMGDERQNMRMKPGDIRLINLLAAQAANAFQNIQTLQNLLQSQKLADLGTVASQLAHDFQSFITLVKLEVPPDNRLRHHANYMDKLVQDLLNYARPQELKMAPVNINQLIDMTLDMIHIPPNIMVEKHYSNNTPEINLDSNQMRRVFLNLFENSIRAMGKEGGRLKITTRPLRPLSKVQRNPWIYIEILDQGEGIPEEFLEKIFDPFFTTYKHKGGNGMGLAIVKQIITRHKGFIDVTSKQGKGTIFNIRLPYLI
ncbi:MAG: hypothetical protein Kow0042_20980 [Calditrichia bacterium]